MSLKEGIEIIEDGKELCSQCSNETDETKWHVRYKGNDYYHPSALELNFKEFCNKNNGRFYLGYVPFCLLTGADINGNHEESIERIKTKSNCKYHLVTFNKWENEHGIGFLFSKTTIEEVDK